MKQVLANTRDGTMKHKDRHDDGKLPGRVPEPKFVSDTNHQGKTLTNKLIVLAKKKVAEKQTTTRMDAWRKSKKFKCVARSLQDYKLKDGKPEVASMLLIAWATLDHHFDEHNNYGDWCRRKKEILARQLECKTIYRTKTKPEDKLLLCNGLEKIFAKCNAVHKLLELAHGMHTNHCKSFNNACTWCVLKNRVYCGSRSLSTRLCLALGVNSLGIHKFVEPLFKKLGVAMTKNVPCWLKKKQKVRACQAAKKKLWEEKKRRNVKKCTKFIEFTRKHQIALAKWEGTCKPGTRHAHGESAGRLQTKETQDNQAHHPQETLCKTLWSVPEVWSDHGSNPPACQ